MKIIKSNTLITIGIITLLIFLCYINFYRNDLIKSKYINDNFLKNLPILETNIFKTNIKTLLDDYEVCDIEIENVSEEYIYGNCIKNKSNSVVISSAGIWKYNIKSNELFYYKYNEDNRIWSFFLDGKYIYYIELIENLDNNIFKWNLIKSDINFNNKTILDYGVLYKPTDTPFFIKNKNTNEILLHTSYDEIEYKKDFQLIKYISRFKIKIYQNGNFIDLVSKSGNHLEKTGEFSCSSAHNIDIQKDKVLYCTVSYNQSEKMIELNINDLKEKIIFENNSLNNYNLISFKNVNGHYIVNLKNKYLIDNSEIVNIIEHDKMSPSYSLSSLAYINTITNENCLVINNNIFAIFSISKNKFLYKLNVNVNFKNVFYLNNDYLVSLDTDDEVYLIKIDNIKKLS